jgi:hypothetical protein
MEGPTRLSPATLAKLMEKFPITKLDSGNYRTCPFRMSYPAIFEKQKGDEGYRDTYGATLLFPKIAKVDLLRNAARECAFEAFGPKAGQMGLKMPFRDQAEKEHKVGYVAGAWFFRATSDDQPGVLDLTGKPITDKKLVYPGGWFIATVRPFDFPRKATAQVKARGVSMGLQNLIKICDDEPFGGQRAEASEEFGDMLAGASDLKELLGDIGVDAAQPGNNYDFG